MNYRDTYVSIATNLSASLMGAPIEYNDFGTAIICRVAFINLGRVDCTCFTERLVC